jgi:hypothetical protein
MNPVVWEQAHANEAYLVFLCPFAGATLHMKIGREVAVLLHLGACFRETAAFRQRGMMDSPIDSFIRPERGLRTRGSMIGSDV